MLPHLARVFGHALHEAAGPHPGRENRESQCSGGGEVRRTGAGGPNAGGGGFSANGGITTKLRLLSIEGAQANGAPALFDGDGAFGFDPNAAIEHVRASGVALARVIEAVGPFRMRLDDHIGLT